jgi:hypothetical protein
MRAAEVAVNDADAACNGGPWILVPGKERASETPVAAREEMASKSFERAADECGTAGGLCPMERIAGIWQTSHSKLTSQS